MKRIISIALAVPMVLALCSAVAFAQSESRSDVLKQIETKRAELAVLEKRLLAPDTEDFNTYADFLKEPNTGLIRLLPRDMYESEVYKKNVKTLTMRGGGAYYSFTRLTHEYGYGSDLCLDSGYLSVGFAGADYGIMLNMHDVPIETVTSEDRGAQFIATYSPPAELPKARLEHQRFGGAGVTVDNELYQTRMRVEVGTTYLLRSINYDTSDVLVAFRVARKDSDGSVIIAWKLLKQYPKPELARNRTDQ